MTRRPRQQPTARTFRVEELEARRLLAADLVVQIDELVRDGDTGTSAVRIFNNGDQDASSVQINSRLTDQFIDPVWQRERAFAQVVRPNANHVSTPAIQTEPLRDINGDGRDDFVVRAQFDNVIVWGGAFPNDEFTDDEAIAAISADASGSLGVVIPDIPSPWIPELGTTGPATFVGDINADGFADLVFNRYVPTIMLGGSDLASRAADDFFSFTAPGGRAGEYPPDLPSAAVYSGDLNGDGIDDLVLTRGGGVPCLLPSSSCTATDRGIYEAGWGHITGGAYVVLGRTDFPDGRIRENSAGVFTFTLDSLNGEGWPWPSAADHNSDGLNDLVLRASGRQYVLFSGDTFEGRDFGNTNSVYLGFTGQDGFVAQRNQIPTVQFETTSGEGNITQVVDIPAGESLIYSINGRVSPSPAEFLTTSAITLQDADENPSDNFLIEQEAVFLEVTTESGLEGNAAAIEISISNFGPDDATDVRISEAVTSLLEDATWSRETKPTWPSDTPPWSESREVPFPQFLSPASWTPDLGPKIAGRGAAKLGDVNGDGFDDVYLNGMIHLGGEFFGETRAIENGSILRVSGGNELLPQKPLGDLNDDGFDDFLASDRGTQYLVFGEPGFPSSGAHAVSDVDSNGLGPIAVKLVGQSDVVAAGDVNGDGLNDLIVGNNIVLGTPDHGLHQVWFESALDSTNSGILMGQDGALVLDVRPVGDLNGDGSTDISMVERRLIGSRVRSVHQVVFGGSHMQVGEVAIADLPRMQVQVTDRCCDFKTTVGDINHDGIDDLLVGGSSSFIIYGKTTLPASIELQELTAEDGFQIDDMDSLSLRATDLNGDGIDDLVILQDIGFERPANATIIFGDGAVPFPSHATESELRGDSRFEQTRISNLTVSDISSESFLTGFDANGDGVDDLLWADYWGGSATPPYFYDTSGEIYMMLGRQADVPNRAGPIDAESINIPAGYTTTFVVSGQLPINHSGDLGEVSIISFGSRANLNPRGASASIGSLRDPSDALPVLSEPVGIDSGANDNSGDGDFADLDGDGDLDLFVTIDGSPNQVWMNDGNGRLSDSGQRLGDGSHIYSSLGDIDGDGDVDAVVAAFAGNANRIWLNDGAGNFSDSGVVLGDASTPSIDVALSDFNGDGSVDIYIANTNQTKDSVFLNNGLGEFVDVTSMSLGMPSASSKSAVAADFNGDGDMDVVTASQDGGAYIHFGLGNGQFVTSSETVGSAAEHVAAGDLDNDGDVDLVFANPGANEIWWNDGSGQFSRGSQTLDDGLTSHIELGDLDGDGDLDIISANWLNEPSRIWLNESVIFLDAGLQIAGSETSEHVALGDVDGDGDLDIHFATRGAASSIYLNQFPVEETPALPADLDGDGEVGFSDFLILSANFGKQDADRPEGDINEDGEVSFADFLALSAVFGTTLD